MSEQENVEIAPLAGVSESIALSVQGEKVEVKESLVGHLTAGEVACEESLIVVGNIGTLGGNAHVLLEGKNLILAAVIEGVVIGLILGLLRRRKG
jgi:hypothetical protein